MEIPNYRIAYIFASRNRPYKFYQALDNIREMSDSNNFFVWAKLDLDDPHIEKYKMGLHLFPEVTIKWGLSKNKIHAICRDCEELPPCDIIIIMSDDQVFEVKGFDDQIRDAFNRHFKNLDGAIHYQDSHALSRTITLSIMGINLYKKLGYLYWHEYTSLYADNDFTDVVRLLGKYILMKNRIHDHYHPIWKMANWDSQYRASEAKELYAKDREVYLNRKARNFDL